MSQEKRRSLVGRSWSLATSVGKRDLISALSLGTQDYSSTCLSRLMLGLAALASNCTCVDGILYTTTTVLVPKCASAGESAGRAGHQLRVMSVVL